VIEACRTPTCPCCTSAAASAACPFKLTLPRIGQLLRHAYADVREVAGIEAREWPRTPDAEFLKRELRIGQSRYVLTDVRGGSPGMLLGPTNRDYFPKPPREASRAASGSVRSSANYLPGPRPRLAKESPIYTHTCCTSAQQWAVKRDGSRFLGQKSPGLTRSVENGLALQSVRRDSGAAAAEIGKQQRQSK
jgi:hypothetical protein